jgi:hypothetical protein
MLVSRPEIFCWIFEGLRPRSASLLVGGIVRSSTNRVMSWSRSRKASSSRRALRSPSDTSVWYGHTHDGWVERLFDSIKWLVDVVCDAAEAGLLAQDHGRLGLRRGEDLLPPDGFPESLRLARCPGSFRLSDPPPGTYLSRMPDPGWPPEWLASLGVSPQALTLTGATHTIAGLIAEAGHGPVAATIRGRVTTGSGVDRSWNLVVDDGTARIVVSCEPSEVVFTVPVGDEAEFDVVLTSAQTPEPATDHDPRLAAVIERFRPSLPIAQARAVRPLPTSPSP